MQKSKIWTTSKSKQVQIINTNTNVNVNELFDFLKNKFNLIVKERITNKVSKPIPGTTLDNKINLKKLIRKRD